MSESLIEHLVGFADERRGLVAGQLLFAQGDAVRSLFVVQSGELRLMRCDSEGRELLVQRARANSVVAEASLYAQQYHCVCRAAGDTTLHVIPKQRLLSALSQNVQLAGQWAAHLAAEVRSSREQIALLGLRTVAQRLDAWLLMHRQQMPARGQWQSLATELGVSAEALYREIARRKKDG